MLQLVYYAPTSLSRNAANILQAFRSAQIRPQLSEIVLDDTQDDWVSIYALRAYAASPGDHLAEQFIPLTQQMLQMLTVPEAQRRELAVQRGHQHRLVGSHYFLDDIASLIDAHPSNRVWFFKLIEAAEPSIAIDFLSSQLRRGRSDEFIAQVLDLLLPALDSYPTHLKLFTVSHLTDENNAQVWEWLEGHFEAILNLSLSQPENRSLKHIARRWARLDIGLRERIPDWDSGYMAPMQGPPILRSTTPYQDLPAYQTLTGLYEQAMAGDRDAYRRLTTSARSHQIEIPVRAVATHFVGQLTDVFKSAYYVMVQQYRYGHVNWDWRINHFDSPVRFEAGEALLTFATAETWEVLVDGFFIRPSNDFMRIQSEWIAYLTDVLSGEDAVYESRHFPDVEARSWFRALADITDEELQRL